MGWLTEYAIRHQRLTQLVILLIFVTGVHSFINLPSREDPEIVVRTAVVSAQYPGMAPERIEKLIAKPIEDAVKEMPEFDKIETVVQTGSVIVKPSVHDRYTELESIWQDLRNKVEDVKAELPEGTHGPYVNDDYGRVASATIMLTGAEFSLEELREVAEDLRDEITLLPLVSTVELYGVQEERIWIGIDQNLLSQFGVSLDQITQSIREQNVVKPGGTYRIDETNLSIEPSGNFESLDELLFLPIKLPDGGVIYLQDISRIERGYVDPPKAPVFYNGEQGIALGISMTSGTNIKDFGRQLSRLTDRLKLSIPAGVQFDYVTYQPNLVEKAVSSATSNLYQTMAVVLAVVMLFLGIRSGLIVGSIVPLTILTAMIGMSFFGINLHRTSIAAIIISLGLLVDNGIVIAEEIKRTISQGVERLQACVDAARTLGGPLLSSSLTTILAFAPLMLAENASSEFLRPLAQVITLALVSSWLLAIIVVPAMCYWFLKGPEEDPQATDKLSFDGPIYRRYRGVLKAVLARPWLLVLFMVSLLMLSMWAFKFVPKQFMAPSDRPQFMVYLDLPAGTGIEETVRVTQRVAHWLRDSDTNPEVINSVAYVDTGGPRFFLALSPPDAAPYRSYLIVNVKQADQVLPMMRRVDAFINDQAPEARGRTEQLFLGPSSIGTIEYRIHGKELSELRRLGKEVSTAFRELPGMRSIYDDWDNPVAKLRVEINQELARRAQVSSDDIATMLNGLIDGLKVTDFREGDKSIPVIVRADDNLPERIDQLSTMNIISPVSGLPVPLLQVAHIVPYLEPSQILRYNKERTLTIYAKHQYLQAGELYQLAEASLAKIELPDGYRVSFGGELESESRATSELFKYMPFCLLLIVALLVGQFNSFRRPLIIVATIPLILIGACFGLLVTQVYFSFNGMLGIFSLAGIILNNGIVLIDKIDQQRALGQAVPEAIQSAAVARFRPIMMTSLTTILGLIPLIVFGGAFWISMGIVISFGLAVGSVLTLLYVPALYLIMFRRSGQPA